MNYKKIATASIIGFSLLPITTPSFLAHADSKTTPTQDNFERAKAQPGYLRGSFVSNLDDFSFLWTDNYAFTDAACGGVDWDSGVSGKATYVLQRVVLEPHTTYTLHAVKTDGTHAPDCGVIEENNHSNFLANITNINTSAEQTKTFTTGDKEQRLAYFFYFGGWTAGHEDVEAWVTED